MCNIKQPVLTLKQFMLRQEVLKLYRQFCRAIKTVPDKTNQIELKQWIRSDFENNKHHKDELVIKMMLQSGRRTLNELEISLGLSGLKRDYKNKTEET